MIFSSNFFPCQAYFSAILNQTEVKINISEQYRKQTYKTRAYILGPHQIETLNVPVIKAANNTEIKEIKIDNKENWQRLQWRTLEACYKKSIYFEYFDYLLKPIFDKPFQFLIDLNQETLTLCLKILQINKTICPQEFSFFENKNEFVSFNAKNRREDILFYQPIVYNQNFGKIFEPNLSILDLLFCEGLEAKLILEKSFQGNEASWI